ncbi:DUF3616 domain-containing protein [Antarcticirhabdus aurantiaca]|uniref:DUF3616 domain-containing protein n=1 Tax=Antarcticirhabdus aurantiaca TaxID=2606717 RepID=A0ACD4NS95_9HYPH|nr:DUF3616 domain-containing protein [Antarcticirhabdus aurantiaca]WAJ29659.1 DUF3616 domain-containing protein [Jeongeuplla avenae]
MARIDESGAAGGPPAKAAAKKTRSARRRGAAPTSAAAPADFAAADALVPETRTARPVARLDFVFGRDATAGPDGGSVATDISCVTLAGRTIFCSCDEAATVERLVLDEAGRVAGDHARFHLGEIFDLPGGPHGEMDIEGLAVADGYLWICGSQALKRRKLKSDAAEAGLDPLGAVRWDENRAFLGRVPLRDLGDGLFEPVALDEGENTGEMPPRRAAMLRMRPSRKAKRSRLRRLLSRDPLIRPFRRLAAKENGIDVEGLAVEGDTVLLGLRGPVVGGHAMIARLRVTETKPGRLKLRRLPDGRRLALHGLDLDGQGVRDLWWQDGRLVVLSGPATDLEALQAAWLVEPFDADKPFYGGADRRAILHLPVVNGADHAEGIALLRLADGHRLLVVYDSPHPDRLSLADNRLSCDAFAHE